jgi:hypothetical protein
MITDGFTAYLPIEVGDIFKKMDQTEVFMLNIKTFKF